MIDSKRLLLGASAAVLGLALTPVLAQSDAAPAAQQPAQSAAPTQAPAAPVQAPAAPSPEQARAEMDKRMEAATAERDKRYEELRKRAAEVGLELPETPPWAQSGLFKPPAGMEPPAMPEAMAQPMPERKPMNREEFEAMRQERWEAMRERAAAMGRELPETPPWEAAEQRRKEMLEKYDQYRATIEAMTDEQKEAIAALFGGRAAEAPARPMGGPMWGPQTGGPGTNCPKGGRPCGRGMMPGYGMGPGMGPGAMGPSMMPMMPGGEAPSEPAPAGDANAPAPAEPAPEQPAG